TIADSMRRAGAAAGLADAEVETTLKSAWQASQARYEGAAIDRHPATDREQPVAPDAARYKLLTGADLEAMPAIRWRIKGVLPERGLAQVYGASKSGKSFLTLDMACAIAGGDSEWFGYRVNQSPVVYLAAEGEAGFKLRTQA